jgi:hypothetical protein
VWSLAGAGSSVAVYVLVAPKANQRRPVTSLRGRGRSRARALHRSRKPVVMRGQGNLATVNPVRSPSRKRPPKEFGYGLCA